VVALNRGVFSAIPRGGIHPERFSSFGIDWWATKSPALAGWAPRIGPPGMADTDGSLKLPLLADRRGISILGLAANESARAIRYTSSCRCGLPPVSVIGLPAALDVSPAYF
jgi:hypothetical protein